METRGHLNPLVAGSNPAGRTDVRRSSHGEMESSFELRCGFDAPTTMHHWVICSWLISTRFLWPMWTTRFTVPVRPRLESPSDRRRRVEPAPRRFLRLVRDRRELIALHVAWPGDLVGPGWTSRPDQWMALVARRPPALLPQRAGDSIVPQCLRNDSGLRSQLHVRLCRRALSSQPLRRFRNWSLRHSGQTIPRSLSSSMSWSRPRPVPG